MVDEGIYFIKIQWDGSYCLVFKTPKYDADMWIGKDSDYNEYPTGHISVDDEDDHATKVGGLGLTQW